MFVVNWPGVGCYNRDHAVALNNFQLVLIDRPDLGTSALGDDFQMEFNYNSITWDTGQSSGGDANCINSDTAGNSAYVGYGNGTSTAGDWFNLPGSGVNNALLDSGPNALINGDLNSTTLGRYIFFVHEGQPSSTPTGMNGYRLAANEGGIFDFGLNFNGSLANVHLNAPIVGMANAPGPNGYLLAGGDGGVFALGGANFYGSLGGQALASPIAAIASTPAGDGYWLASMSGKVYHFGNTPDFPAIMLPATAHITGMASTPDGKGVWLTDQLGDVYTEGDAGYLGGANTVHPNAPVVGIAALERGQGYVQVGADGGVYTYGVGFVGSVPGTLAADGATSRSRRSWGSPSRTLATATGRPGATAACSPTVMRRSSAPWVARPSTARSSGSNIWGQPPRPDQVIRWPTPSGRVTGPRSRLRRHRLPPRPRRPRLRAEIAVSLPVLLVGGRPVSGDCLAGRIQRQLP